MMRLDRRLSIVLLIVIGMLVQLRPTDASMSLLKRQLNPDGTREFLLSKSIRQHACLCDCRCVPEGKVSPEMVAFAEAIDAKPETVEKPIAVAATADQSKPPTTAAATGQSSTETTTSTVTTSTIGTEKPTSTSPSSSSVLPTNPDPLPTIMSGLAIQSNPLAGQQLNSTTTAEQLRKIVDSDLLLLKQRELPAHWKQLVLRLRDRLAEIKREKEEARRATSSTLLSPSSPTTMTPPTTATALTTPKNYLYLVKVVRDKLEQAMKIAAATATLPPSTTTTTTTTTASFAPTSVDELTSPLPSLMSPSQLEEQNTAFSSFASNPTWTSTTAPFSSLAGVALTGQATESVTAASTPLAPTTVAGVVEDDESDKSEPMQPLNEQDDVERLRPRPIAHHHHQSVGLDDDNEDSARENHVDLEEGASSSTGSTLQQPEQQPIIDTTQSPPPPTTESAAKSSPSTVLISPTIHSSTTEESIVVVVTTEGRKTEDATVPTEDARHSTTSDDRTSIDTPTTVAAVTASIERVETDGRVLDTTTTTEQIATSPKTTTTLAVIAATTERVEDSGREIDTTPKIVTESIKSNRHDDGNGQKDEEEVHIVSTFIRMPFSMRGAGARQRARTSTTTSPEPSSSTTTIDDLTAGRATTTVASEAEKIDQFPSSPSPQKSDDENNEISLHLSSTTTTATNTLEETETPSSSSSLSKPTTPQSIEVTTTSTGLPPETISDDVSTTSISNSPSSISTSSSSPTSKASESTDSTTTLSQSASIDSAESTVLPTRVLPIPAFVQQSEDPNSIVFKNNTKTQLIDSAVLPPLSFSVDEPPQNEEKDLDPVQSSSSWTRDLATGVEMPKLAPAQPDLISTLLKDIINGVQSQQANQDSALVGSMFLDESTPPNERVEQLLPTSAAVTSTQVPSTTVDDESILRQHETERQRILDEQRLRRMDEEERRRGIAQQLAERRLAELQHKAEEQLAKLELAKQLRQREEMFSEAHFVPAHSDNISTSTETPEMTITAKAIATGDDLEAAMLAGWDEMDAEERRRNDPSVDQKDEESRKVQHHYKLQPHQCAAINKFTRVFRIADPSKWVLRNCSFARRYFPQASCDQIQRLIESCFAL